MNTENIIEEVITKTDDLINITANNINVDCITSSNNKFSLDSDGNLVVNSITTTTGNSIDFDSIYPVGSIYFNTTNTNPSSVFGGTWERIAAGRCLIGAGAKEEIKSNSSSWCGDLNNSNYSFSLGEMAGQFRNKLTTNEMPSHTHTQKEHFHKVTSRMNISTGGNNGTEFGINRGTLTSKGDFYSLETQGTSNDLATNARVGALPTTAVNNNTGGNQAHNNMPPYLVVNIWKRIA